jgi:hypothetical protein
MFENGTFLMEIKNRNSDFCEQRREMEASLKRSASDADLRAGGDQSAVSEGGLDNGAMTDDQKQEDDRDSSNDSDANMHRQLGLPCVPIGQHFHFAGRQFVRVSLKSARCLAPRCSTLGGKVLSDKGYGKLTMTQHAEACLRKESQPTPAERATSHQAERQLAKEAAAAAAEDAWLCLPPREVQVEFKHGVLKSFFFKNVHLDGKRGQQCELPNCTELAIKVVGDYHAAQHAKRYHPPVEALDASMRTSLLGGGGAGMISGFFAKAKAAGKQDKEALEEHNKRVQVAEGSSQPRPAQPRLSVDSYSSSSLALCSSSSSSSSAAASSFSYLTTSAPSGKNTREQTIQGLLDELVSLRGDVEPLVLCAGFGLSLADPAHENYPVLVGQAMEVNWTFPNEQGNVFALEGDSSAGCSVTCTSGVGDVCAACMALGSCVKLQRLIARARDPNIRKSPGKHLATKQPQLQL